MPTYHVATPDGREFDLESDRDLNAAEVAAMVTGAPAEPGPVRGDEGETPSRGRDLLNRVFKGGAQGVGQSLQGAARLGYAIGQALGADSDVTPEMRESRLGTISPAFRLGRDLVEGAEDAFPTDTARDRNLASVLASAAGQMVPTIASGGAGRVAAAIQYGLSAGEQGAQEAIAAGRPDLATPAFSLYAPLGAVSEGALGVAPRFIPGLREGGRGVLRALVLGAGKEGAQEGLEQAGQNVGAKDVLGFDPERGRLQDVPLSIVAGALLGGPVAAVPPALNRLSGGAARKPDSKELAEPIDLEPVPERGTEQAAPEAPPPSVDSVQGSAAAVPEPAQPAAVFRGPQGQEYLVELGSATLEQVQEVMFRTQPGVEFLELRGADAANAADPAVPAPSVEAQADETRDTEPLTPPDPSVEPDLVEPQRESAPVDLDADLYREQVAQVVDNRPLGGPMLELGRPSQNLQAAGLPDQRIRVSESVLRKISQGRDPQHRLSRQHLEDLPRALNDPIMSFDHANGNLDVLTELVVGGENAIVGVRVNRDAGRGVRIASIATVFGKRAESLAHWIESGRMRWWNKPKTEAWLRSNGAPIAHRVTAALRSREQPTPPAAESQGSQGQDAESNAQTQPAAGSRNESPGPAILDSTVGVLGRPPAPAAVAPEVSIESRNAPDPAGMRPAPDSGGSKAAGPAVPSVVQEHPAPPTAPEPTRQAHEPAAAFLAEGGTPSPAAEAAATAAAARVRSALQPPRGMHVPNRGRGAGEAGFINLTVVADLVVAGARVLRRLGGRAAGRARWAAAMVKDFGQQVARYLSAVWNRIARIGAGVRLRLSPDALGHRNQIEELAGRTNIPEEERPLYGEDVLDKGRARLGRALAPKSVQIRMLGSRDLLDAKQRMDIVEATQTAAVRRQAAQLRDQLVATAQASHPSGWWLPRWLVGTRRARHFMDRALHVAARLNPSGRDASGNFVWGDFRQRMGFLTPRAFASGGHSVGGSLTWVHPVLGTKETVTIGPLVQNAEGRPVFQLFRDIPASVQGELYDHYRTEFPDMIWFLDMFIDPALKDTRVTHNGVEIPIFNRVALATMMAAGDPAFQALDAYTPDVLVTRSLLGAIRGALGFSAGARSPGRRYKTGASRESGNVRDLLSGFNVRTVQALRERTRREWARAVMREATPIQNGVVPAGWSELDTGMKEVWNAVQRLRAWRSPRDPKTGNPIFPETEARLTDDGSPEWKAFFGEAARLRGRRLMIPERLVNLLKSQYRDQIQHGILYRLGAWAIRNSTRLFLVAPTTYVANVASNDLFTLEAATRRILSGILGAKPQDLRFARNLFLAEAAGRFMGLREAIGLGDQTQFMRTVRDVLPDTVFAESTGLEDLAMRLDESAWSYLREGEIGAAALQMIQYGNVDLRFKQRMAYAWLRAQAVTNARKAGLRGRALGAAVDAYLANPPLADRAQAVSIANFELLNYADTPDWLQNRTSDYWKLLLPFPRFGYHYLAKNARRATALRDVVSRVPRQRRADALADFLTFVLWPAGGLGVLAGAALRAASDGEDDDEARMLVGVGRSKVLGPDGDVTSKPLDRTLVTANRVNLSAWARAAGLGGEKGDDDFWWRVRNYPVIAMAGAAILAEQDARRFGVKEGVRTYLGSSADLASDFFSLGMAAKVPLKAWQTLSDTTQGRNPPPVIGDPYATRVPFVAYVTDQTLDAFVPGSRQADMVIRWVDPMPRRRATHRGLGFNPGAWDAARVGHVTGLLDRLLAGEQGRSTLPPEGTVDRSGRIDAREVPLTQRLAELGGLNVRPIDREKYRAALAQ